MAPKKEKTEEKKYVQLTPESVQMVAANLGLGQLQPEVSAQLSEDASYRLRELAHVSRTSHCGAAIIADPSSSSCRCAASSCATPSGAC